MSAIQKSHDTTARPDPMVEMIPVPAVIDSQGDKVVTLYDQGGRPQTRRIAELVLEAFRGPRPPGYEPRFADGNRLNCSIENLEWAPIETGLQTFVMRNVTSQPIWYDAEGRPFDEAGNPLAIPGQSPAEVLQAISDIEAGRVRPLREVLDGSKR